jgi:hypothetical protein
VPLQRYCYMPRGRRAGAVRRARKARRAGRLVGLRR